MRRRLGPAVVVALGAALAAPTGATAADGRCGEPPHPAGEWPSYGHDLANSRSQPNEDLIGTGNASALEPAFVHRAPGLINNTPIVDGGCVFVTSQGESSAVAHVAALDADDGAVIWSVEVEVGVPGYAGPVVGSPALTDELVIAPINREGAPFLLGLDRHTGEERFRATVDTQPTAGINGSVVTHDGFAVVGFFGRAGPWEAERGGLAIYDIASGELTKTFPIPDDDFAAGHAGAGIWATPAIDTETGFLYVGTSNPHNPHLEHERANSILKIDLRRGSATFGQILAAYKGVPDTVVEGAQRQPVCEAKDDVYYYGRFSVTCLAVDLDFGASPNLYTDADGRTLVGNLQKAGVYHVVDAGDMTEVARATVGTPCFACNAASSAFSDGSAFVAAGPPGQLVAVDGTAGTPGWAAPIASGFTYNAVSVANGVVWTVDSPGFLNGYDQATGVQLVKRPLRDDTGESMFEATTSSGIAIARNTLYAAATQFVIAYRPAS